MQKEMHEHMDDGLLPAVDSAAAVHLLAVCEDPKIAMAIYQALERCSACVELMVADCAAAAQTVDSLGCIPALAYIADATQDIDAVGWKLQQLLERVPLDASSSEHSPISGAELVPVINELRSRVSKALGIFMSCRRLLSALESTRENMCGLEGLVDVGPALRAAIQSAVGLEGCVSKLDSAHPAGLEGICHVWPSRVNPEQG